MLSGKSWTHCGVRPLCQSKQQMWAVRVEKGELSFKQATTQHNTTQNPQPRRKQNDGCHRPGSCQSRPFHLREGSEVLEMTQGTAATPSHGYAQNTYSHFITEFKLQPASSHGVNTKCSFGEVTEPSAGGRGPRWHSCGGYTVTDCGSCQALLLTK